ncbi:MAG: glycosyltransferase family 39 protein [Candidatus Methanoperedens sp.]|nr:glycosyltransferase family 39 protein [Candidatus Methanoperedens sp.]
MKKRGLFVVIVIYIAVRIYIATLSSYGLYHGWNEGHYSNIARNYFTQSMWYQTGIIGGENFNGLPPFFSYTVFAFFNIFGVSDLSARMVSIFSEIIAIFGVYLLAREIYGEKTALMSSVIFIFIPWNILWFGRVQTDPLMTAFMICSMALYIYAYKNEKSMLPFGIVLGLGVFTKQPALAVIPILAIWSYFNGLKRKILAKSVLWILVGLIPLIIWLLYYMLQGNIDFVRHIIYGELTNRIGGTIPFSDLVRVTIAIIIGASPLVIIVAFYEIIKTERLKNSLLFIWGLLYGFFVLIRTPLGHEYYSLPLMPVFAIFAANGISRLSGDNEKKKTIFTALLILSMLPFTFGLLSYTGELGYTATRDVANYMNNYMDMSPDVTYLVIAHVKYTPQLIWYSNLTETKDSKRNIYQIGDDIQIKTIKYMAEKYNATTVFLITDGVSVLDQQISKYYTPVFKSTYETKLPYPPIVNKGMTLNDTFEQHLSLYKLEFSASTKKYW